MVYEDKHRYFVQLMLAKKIVTVDAMKKLYDDVCREFDNNDENEAGQVARQDLPSFITEINSRLRPFCMEIRSTVCEVTGDRFYVMRSSREDAVSRKSTDWTGAELDVIKKMMDKIMDSDERCISQVDCLHIGADMPKKMPYDEMISFVGRLVSSGWLVRSLPSSVDVDRRCSNHSDEKRLCLSALFIAEMEPYLRYRYGERVQNCHLCKTIVVTGPECDSCEIRLHRHCAKRHLKDTNRSKQQVRCPECRCDWPSLVRLISDDAFLSNTSRTTTSAAQRSSSSSAGVGIASTSSASVNASTAADDSNDDDSD